MAVLISLTGIVILAGSGALGLRFSVSQLFGIVFVAFTWYYY